MQCMVIEYARDVAGMEKANSAEFDPETPDAVIATMASQVDVVAGERDIGGTMRLGSYPAALQNGSVVAAPTARPRSPSGTGTATRWPTPTATGCPRPGWSSPAPRPTACWWSSSSCRPTSHPFFVGTQAHPELKSRPTRPHPLFAAFVQAAVDFQESARLPVPRRRGAEKVGI